MKTVVVLFADGFEEIEALSPVDYLRRAGCQVEMLAVGQNETLVRGAHEIRVAADLSLNTYMAQLKNSEKSLPDAIVIPGGIPGAPNIAASAEANELIKMMLKNEKLIGCICASPAVVLPSAGVLDGRKWTCYPGMQEQAGEKYLSSHEDKPFVHDKNLITGRGPGAAEEFSMEIVRTLCGEETAAKIKKGAVQR